YENILPVRPWTQALTPVNQEKSPTSPTQFQIAACHSPQNYANDLSYFSNSLFSISRPKPTPKPFTSLATAPNPPLRLAEDKSTCSQGTSPSMNLCRKRAAST